MIFSICHFYSHIPEMHSKEEHRGRSGGQSESSLHSEIKMTIDFFPIHWPLSCSINGNRITIFILLGRYLGRIIHMLVCIYLVRIPFHSCLFAWFSSIVQGNRSCIPVLKWNTHMKLFCNNFSISRDITIFICIKNIN